MCSYICVFFPHTKVCLRHKSFVPLKLIGRTKRMELYIKVKIHELNLCCYEYYKNNVTIKSGLILFQTSSLTIRKLLPYGWSTCFYFLYYFYCHLNFLNIKLLHTFENYLLHSTHWIIGYEKGMLKTVKPFKNLWNHILNGMMDLKIGHR